MVELASQQHPQLNQQTLLLNDPGQHGHFYTFKLGSTSEVAELAAFLKENGIMTDYRGDRLRFGFGLYQNSTAFDLSCLRQA